MTLDSDGDNGPLVAPLHRWAIGCCPPSCLPEESALSGVISL